MRLRWEKICLGSAMLCLALCGVASAETITGEVRAVNSDKNTIRLLTRMPGTQPEQVTVNVPDDAFLSGIRSLEELEVGDSVEVEVDQTLTGQKKAKRLIVENKSVFDDEPPLGGQTWKDKLSRGAVNVFTSPVEIPRMIEKVRNEKGPAQGWTIGLFQGVGRTLLRIGAGLLEVLTFPFNFPDPQKDPLVEPEFAWQEWPGAQGTTTQEDEF